jgi:hypothetical protein
MAYSRRRKTTRRRKRRSTKGIGYLGANFTTIASAGVGSVLATNIGQLLPPEWTDDATAPMGSYTVPALQIGAGIGTNMLLKGTDAKIREGLAAGMFAVGMGTILGNAITMTGFGKRRGRKVGYGARYLAPNNVPTPQMVTGKRKIGRKMINPTARREVVTGQKQSALLG